MLVYKFLNFENGVNNLALKRMKISLFDQLNDPFELMAVDLSDPRDERAIVNMKKEIGKSNGMLCFSAAWKSPLIWGHYADSHKGMAIGVEIKNEEEHLIPVQYIDERIKIFFNDKDRQVENAPKIVDILIKTKAKEWAYEREYRMYAKRDESNYEFGRYFVDLDDDIKVKEVVLGNDCEFSLTKINQLLNLYNHDIKIKKATLSKNKFEIIEDENFRS